MIAHNTTSNSARDRLDELMSTNVNGDDYILFYRAGDADGFLSQWYPSDFYVDGQLFTMAEQFMMYMKAKTFDDFETMETIFNTPHSGLDRGDVRLQERGQERHRGRCLAHFRGHADAQAQV
jgi:predicted NAD-dependent protein-ADP-ribosyltransferase YbiA (DUF1768 family)